jgi:Zn-dependent membrane protease YugP
MFSPEEHAGAIDALNWAARTYVAAAIVSLSSLLYFIFL